MISRRTESLLWVGLGLALLAILLLLPLPRQTTLWRMVFDSGHVVVFAGFALALLRLGRLWWPRQRPYLVAAAAIVLFAFGTEGLQFFTARDADVNDLVRDIVGGLATLGFCYSFAGRHPAWRAWLLRAVVVLAVAASLVPLGRCYYAYRVRAAAFPRLIAFESETERVFFEPRGVSVSFSAGKAEIVFKATDHGYPGFGAEVVADWRGYEQLHLVVRNLAPEPVILHLRVHDSAHHRDDFSDRFNTEFELIPGVNELDVATADIARAPATRTLELARVANLTLFMTAPAHEVTLLVDEVRLR